jgi:hypothetical protein
MMAISNQKENANMLMIHHLNHQHVDDSDNERRICDYISSAQIQTTDKLVDNRILIQKENALLCRNFFIIYFINLIA